METKHDFIGSWWAKKGSYGKTLANMPGSGAGHMGGAPGAYITSGMKSGDPGVARPGRKMGNNPGMGSGHMSNTPVGGKKGYIKKTGRSSRMKMGEE